MSNDRWVDESNGRRAVNDNWLDDGCNARASESDGRCDGDGCDDGDRRGFDEGCVRRYWYNVIGGVKCKDDGCCNVRGYD